MHKFEVVIQVLIGAISLSKRTQEFLLNEEKYVPSRCLESCDDILLVAQELFEELTEINLKDKLVNWGINLFLVDIKNQDDIIEITYGAILPEPNHNSSKHKWFSLNSIFEGKDSQSEYLKEKILKFGGKH